MMKRFLLLLPLLVWVTPSTADNLFFDRLFTLAGGVGAAATSVDGYNTPVAVGVDFRFEPTDYLGIAVGYREFEPFEAEGSVDAELDVSAPSVGLLFYLPFASRWRLLLRNEAVFWDAEARALSQTTGRDDGISYGVGLGVGVAFNRWLGMEAEAGQIEDVSGADITQFMLRVAFRL